MSNMFNGSTLAPGKYIISSPMAGNAPVGRLGNIVVVLPNGEQPPIWTVEKRGDAYILKIDGETVTSQDGRTIVDPYGHDNEWTITDAFTGKPDYVIASKSGLGTNGWIAAEEAPVTIRVLIVGPRVPPYYPPNEYFTFTPVEA